MIKFKGYRWLRVIFGARSFIKKSDDGGTIFILVKHDSKRVANILLSEGYVEEWPVYTKMEENNG